MKRSRLALFGAMILCAGAAMPALAQRSPYTNSLDADEPGGVIYEAGVIEFVRTTPELRSILDRARPLDPNNVAAPKFALRTRDNSFILSIGGQINPILGYDISNDLYDTDAKGSFVVGDIPVPPQRGKKGAFFIDPLEGYIDFTVVGFAGTKNEVTGYIKLGTNGANHNSVLKRAYVSWRGVTAGLTATLMKDALAAQPPTIDPQGPCGDVSATAYAIDYVSPSFSGFRFAAGIEMPTFYSSNGLYRGKDYRHHLYYGKQVTSEANQLVPDIPAWVEYAASSSNRVRLSGLLRNFAYYDLVSEKTRRLVGWGAMLSGNFSFYKPLTFNFQAAYGKGIANYIQDIAGRPLSFTPKEDDPGRMTANPMMGLVFGASWNISKRLQVNAVGSYSRIWDVGAYADIDDTLTQAGEANYRSGIYVAANCFYNITSYLQWGVEYLYGRHQTWTFGSANDHRIQTQLSFSF